MKQFLTSSLVLMYLVAWLPVASVTHALDAPSTCGTDTSHPACIYFTTTGAGNTVPLDSSGNFTVTVKVNTGNRDSSGAEVRVQFTPSQIEFVDGEFPTGNDSTGHPFYPYKFGDKPIANSSSVIIMNRIVNTPGAGQPVIYTKGVGTFAILTFKPKTGVTQFDLSFIFVPDRTAYDSSVASNVSGEGDILGYARNIDQMTITSAPNPTGVLNHVDIAPTAPTVAPNGTQSFTATAHDASHNAVTATYAWTQTGEGSISPATGATTTFTAGANTGTATVTVTATQASGTGTITKTATANVTINNSGPFNPIPGGSAFITSISPTSGQKDAATQVTITGGNFGAFDATSKVYFGMAEATILDWSNSRIVVRVPAAPEITSRLTVTVRALTSDDKTAEYLGYTYTMTGGRLPDNGPETYTWIGLLMAAFGFAGLAYLKLSGQPTSSRL